jgi:hypothetical protein
VTAVVEHLDRVRLPGKRTWLHVGDTVRVAPSRPGKHDGFDSPVLRIDALDGQVVAVDVVDPRNGAVRPMNPRRITRRRRQETRP